MRNISIWTSGSRGDSLNDILYLELLCPLGWVEWNTFCNCSRRHYGEHFCETFFYSYQWYRRCRLRSYLVLWWPLRSAKYGTICAILVEGMTGNIPVKLLFWDEWFRRCRLKKKYTHDGQTIHDGGRPITKAPLESSAQVS